MTNELVMPVRIAVAAVWLAFGVGAKLLRLVPRHERIVARILGESVAPVMTRLIGCGEVFVGLWVLSAIAPFACAAFQTSLIVSMNTLELVKARDLLWSPSAMLLGNTVLLAAAWWLATV